MFFYLIKNISETRYKKCMCIYAVECFYVNVYPNRGIKKSKFYIPKRIYRKKDIFFEIKKGILLKGIYPQKDIKKSYIPQIGYKIFAIYPF